MAVIAGVLLCVIYGSFLLHPITLVTADLGRHVKNGEFLMRGASADASLPARSVLRHNFYSYTEPDLPLVNHHWASGILFYIVWQGFGWTGVHLFFITLSLAAFLIFYSVAVSRAGAGIAALMALAIIPLLAERTEIRPEAFSYLFSGVFLWVLLRFREGKISFRACALIIFIFEVLWANMHIYFFLGPLLAGAFLLESLLEPSGRKQRSFRWAGLAGLGALGALCSPFGVRGVTYPFTILRNYGYRLAENQPVWFMEKLMHDPNFTIFKLVFWFSIGALLVLPFVAYGALRYAKRIPEGMIGQGMRYLRQNGALILIFAGASAMAWLQIRNFALFGFFTLPITAGGLAYVFKEGARRYRRELAAGAVALLTLVLFVALSGDVQKFFPYWRQFGLGLEKGDSGAADFFKREHLTGPILNNYDIGGYLIFHLFPEERVFVDNRPEAYSVSFFRDTYIPLQESQEAWKQALGRYGFNVIVFSHRDATPWGQHFLITRIQDPEWVPVFADAEVIIFLKNTKANSPAIEKYAIPRENFSVVGQRQ